MRATLASIVQIRQMIQNLSEVFDSMRHFCFVLGRDRSLLSESITEMAGLPTSEPAAELEESLEALSIQNSDPQTTQSHHSIPHHPRRRIDRLFKDFYLYWLTLAKVHHTLLTFMPAIIANLELLELEFARITANPLAPLQTTLQRS